MQGVRMLLRFLVLGLSLPLGTKYFRDFVLRPKIAVERHLTSARKSYGSNDNNNSAGSILETHSGSRGIGGDPGCKLNFVGFGHFHERADSRCWKKKRCDSGCSACTAIMARMRLVIIKGRASK